MITIDQINPAHELGFGDGGYLAVATDGTVTVTLYGEYTADDLRLPDIESAHARLAAKIAELREAPGYGDTFVPCWLFFHASALEVPIVVSPPGRSYLAPAELREQDARNYPHDEPCPRCGRRQWTDENDQETCQACGANFSDPETIDAPPETCLLCGGKIRAGRCRDCGTVAS